MYYVYLRQVMVSSIFVLLGHKEQLKRLLGIKQDLKCNQALIEVVSKIK